MPDHEVAIIGAGLSGLGMGNALKRAGIEDFVIYERAGDVGGTWRDNTYPGVGVDIPTFAYQFSYELKPDWSRVFARGAEVKGYIDDAMVHTGDPDAGRMSYEVFAGLGGFIGLLLIVFGVLFIYKCDLDRRRGVWPP